MRVPGRMHASAAATSSERPTGRAAGVTAAITTVSAVRRTSRASVSSVPTRERLEATLEAAFAMAASLRWCCRLTVTSRNDTTHSCRPGTWLSR